MKKKEKNNKSNNNNLSSKEIFNRAQNSIKDPDKVFNLLDSNGITAIELKLPPKFFENILMGEMYLMENFSMKKLKKLMDLYTIAVEYYLETDVERAKHYQNRMEYFITNKDILNNLSKRKKNMDKIDEENSDEYEDEPVITRSRAATRGKLETQFLIQNDSTNQEILNKKVNSVLNKESCKKRDKEDVKNIINNEMSKQNKKWKEKLAQKKTRMRVNTFTRKLIQTPNPKRERPQFLSNQKEYQIFRKNTGKFTASEFKTSDNTSDFSEDDNDFIKNFKAKQEDENSSINLNDNISENEPSNEEKLNEIKEEEKEKEKEEEKEKENAIEMNIKETKIESNDGNLLLKEKLEEEENNKIPVDDDLLKTINEKMKKIDEIEKIKEEKSDNESENEESNNINEKKFSIEEIPPKFHQTYYDIEAKMDKYIKDLNEYFHKDIFYHFSSQLKELYDSKYKKYIEVNNYYHTNIKQYEYSLEYDENLTEERKQEYQSIINSLKEEQQDQIDKIEDEFNGMIHTKINEFKQTSIKNNCGINLIEEQVKLDIYSLINDAFY